MAFAADSSAAPAIHGRAAARAGGVPACAVEAFWLVADIICGWRTRGEAVPAIPADQVVEAYRAAASGEPR